MKPEKFPLKITEKGVSAIIRQSTKVKGKKKHKYFIVEYILFGERKQVWRSDLNEAKAVASDACIKIANGKQSSLKLSDRDEFEYNRASEIVSPIRVPVDIACREYVDALKILEGKSSIIEVCREWVRRNTFVLPKITVEDATGKLLAAAIADKKSNDRLHQLRVLLGQFSEAFQCDVHTITPLLVSKYLTALTVSERTKCNHRDAISHFNGWLVLHGYLAKGTDWMDGVQKYSKRKHGDITIYTPDEMKIILNFVKNWQVSFIAIAAFSALRHSEIKRLDWAQIELSEKPGESFIEVLAIAGTKSDQRRRLVPVSDNLKAWLKPHARNFGKVCPIENTKTILPKIIKASGVEFKKNALRHSGISYRVAHTGDIARVADDSGNSVSVIRSNYLRRVKPSAAAEWFSIVPA